MRQCELAVQLPETVAQDRGAVREIWMTVRFALRPVADVVLADHAVGTGHPHQRAAVDEQPFEPERAIVGAVDEPPMHAERVTEADRDGAHGKKEGKRSPGEEDRRADDTHDRHRRDPGRFHWLPMDAAFSGAGLFGVYHAGRAKRAPNG